MSKKRKESQSSPQPFRASQPSPKTQESAASSTPSQSRRRRFSWADFKERLGVMLLYFLIGGPILGPVIGGIIYVPFYRGSLRQAELTVDRRERIVKSSGDSTQSYYLVWSKEGEVFCVSDTWSFMKFDSSDRYGKLREGSQIRVQVAGWRVPFLSWYRNIIVIDEVKEPAQP